MADELQDFLADVRARVDARLDELVPAANITPVNLHEAIRWSLFAGGKRVRPALVYAAGTTFGAPLDKLDSTAAAIEMIHTYSLIHDDLPAMDDDDLRRGKPTCHKQFGDATAILAGDVLQTLAFKAIADDAELEAGLRLRLISLIAEAAGTPDGMVAGQQIDLESEGKAISSVDLDGMHSLKTGALITAAAVAGAMIGGAEDADVVAVRQYAVHLGLLFQITDDLLDVTQHTSELGKTSGKDAVAAKATYPSLHGLERSREMAENTLKAALSALDPIARDTLILRRLAEAIGSRTR